MRGGGDENGLTTDHTFTGQKVDGTGLLYYNARYYDPQIGQFISPDSIVPDPTVLFDYNRYMYVRGNPVKYTDPSGHCIFGLDTLVCVGFMLVGAALFLQTDDTTRELTPEQINSQKLGAGLLFGTAAVWVAEELVDPSNPNIDDLDEGDRLLEGPINDSPTVDHEGVWPDTPEEMDDILGFKGTRIPDGPTTTGRDKVIWQAADDVEIVYEQHQYHTQAPVEHRDPHWHLSVPGDDHQRFLPGEPIPGY